MTKPALDTDPRKQPRQARAKDTVHAVVTAAAQVLVSHGYEATTTARIAERAGVSVGSLYQYFPNKQAIVAALIERHAEQIVAVMEDVFCEPTTLEDGLRAMIAAATAAHRIDPELHRILNEQVPRVGRLAKAMDTSGRITKALERFLRAHAKELHPDRDPAVTAEVVEITIEALGHNAIARRRGLTQAFERETFAIVAGYVLGPAPAPPPRRAVVARGRRKTKG